MFAAATGVSLDTLASRLKKNTMKKQVLVILISIFFISCQKENISIQGKFKGIENNAEITLIDISSKEKIASSTASNGYFELNGYLKDSVPSLYWLQIKTKESTKILNLMLQPNENISIDNIGNDYPKNLKISGSKHSSEFYEYYKLMEPLDNERELATAKFSKIEDKTSQIDSIYWGKNGLITLIDKKYEEQTKSFIEKNYDTYFGLSTLSRYYKSFSKDELKLMYSNLSKELKNSRYGQLVKIYSTNSGLVIGNKYIDFEAINENDEKIKFSDCIGSHFTLLNFSTYHCVPSMKSFEEISALSKKYNSKLKIVNYYVDADINGFESFLKSDHENWNFLRNIEGRFSSVYALYNITSTPTIFLFDKKGILIKKLIGFDAKTKLEIEKKISY